MITYPNNALRPCKGSRVEVYRNLHKKMWSVKLGGLVLAYADMVALENVTFAVQPAGNRKVRETGNKNVHAFARGTVIALGKEKCLHSLGNVEWDRTVIYDPHKFEHFVAVWPAAQEVYVPIHKAVHCLLLENGTVLIQEEK